MTDYANILPLGLNDADTDWMEEAHCRNSNVPVDLFFPGRGGHASSEPARTVCSQCSVTEQCLNYALNNHISIGIYGGTSGRNRRYLQRERNEQSQRQRD